MKLKKLLLSAAAFASMAAICAVVAGADSGEHSSGFWKYYVQDDGTIHVSSYSGLDSTLNIPSTIDGLTVSGISSEAFRDKTGISKVNIPSSVTYIGGRAFAGSSITSINIPSSVTEFGEYWYNYETFKDCDNLTTVTFNASTNVPDSAFYDCDALKTVTIGNLTTSISSSAFESCDSLTTVNLGNKVSSIGSYAFKNTDIKSISIPSSVSYIGGEAFRNTKLTSVNIPATVTEFGESWNYCDTFRECSDLTTVTFNASTNVPSRGFEDCGSLKTVTIGNKTTAIDKYAFSGCTALQSVKIGEKVKYIGVEAFYNTKSLKSVTGGSVISAIYDSAFRYSGLKSYAIPETVTFIDYRAFSDSSLESVTIPSSVTEWGSWYGTYAFAGCENLKTVKIGQAAMPDTNDLFRDSNKVKIYCISGSAAHEYAKTNGIANSATLKSIKSTSLKLSSGTYNLAVGETLRLFPAVAPQNTTDRIEWISGDTSIATVDGAGIITGVSAGTVAIQAKSTSGLVANCAVTVAEGITTSTDKGSKKSISLAAVSVANQYYTGKTLTPAPTVKYNDVITLQNGRDYTLTYSNNTAIGTAKVTIKGIGNYTGTIVKSFTITKLSAVSGLAVSARTGNSLTLKWNKNSAANGYILEMLKNGKWTRITKISDNSKTSYKVNGLGASTVYRFRIRAYRMNGSAAIYSNYSAETAIRTNPVAITGAKLTGRAADALKIGWNKTSSADGYIVEMYKGGKWVRAAKITNNSTTTFKKSGLSASTVYKFRVRAYKMSGSTALYGAYSTVITVRTNPTIIKGVKIAGKAKDALRVSWNRNTSAQGYIVEMYKGGKWVRVAKIESKNETTYRQAGLAKNTTYKFRVRAYHMSGKTALYGNYGSVSGKTAAK